MFKKSLIILSMVLVFTIASYIYVKNVYHVDKNTLVTFIKPPSEDIKKKLPQGSDLDTPLTIPRGFRLAVFSNLLSSPRVLAIDPNGVLFVSLPSAGKVIALPDTNEDGIADGLVNVVTNLNRPHGIAFGNGKIFIAETDKIVAYNYDSDNFSIVNRTELISLPTGGRHWSRTINIHEDKLYISVGSSCDVCREKDERRSAILISNLDGSNSKLFASGLRNTVFFDFDSKGRMWGNDMGRDFLGDDLPPDELNIILEGRNYGWPWCYGEKVRDYEFQEGSTYNCAETEGTVYDYPAHIAPLGLRFIDSKMFDPEFQGDLLSVFHGSWNSSVPVGYKIVKLEINDDKVNGIEDFISGWLEKDGDVLGRPVDLIFNEKGILYISDDKANLVYMLTKEN